MTLRSLLLATALLFAGHPAAAQMASPQLPQPQREIPTHIPVLTVPNATLAPHVYTTPAPAPLLTLNKPDVINHRCLAIRSYNYTADANTPQRSGSTTCTIAKSNGATYAIAPATR